jgi:uncharacterized protein YprB with RNaseH-like and TPR domain
MSKLPLSKGLSPQTLEAEVTAELEKLGVRRGVTGLRPSVPEARDSQAFGIESVVPGRVVETPMGPCFVAETRYPLDHAHGGAALGALSPGASPSPLLARLLRDERLSTLDYQSALFFDIETTGLGIGAGLVAFLVGLGTFEGDEFCVRQYFLRDYSEEPALLYLLDSHMRHYRWWVSFNGRGFDLPVLQTRFVCNHQSMLLSDAPHLDLLPPARRLWRKRLGSCRLSALEANVLGLTRNGDVPGWLVPELYFEYLRHGDAMPLRQVFLHNEFDILSLVTLAARLEQVLGHLPVDTMDHPVDLYSLGLICEALREDENAQRAYSDALQNHLPPDLQEDALFRLSMLHKRSGHIEQAVPIWRALQKQGQVQAHVELAKYHERAERNYPEAARVIGQALSLSALPERGPCSAAALRQRFTRLRDKAGDGGLPMPHVESYSFGSIAVDGTTYTSDLLILPGRVVPGWWRKEGHCLEPEDLQEVIEAQPTVLVIGTGNLGMMTVPQATLEYLATRNIRTLVERTALACERYNDLAQTKKAAAALHLTC